VIIIGNSTCNEKGNTSKNIIIEYPDIIHYEVNVSEKELNFYSTDDNGIFFENHKNLKSWIEKKNKELIFAMNGGMYKKDLSPQGLYIQNGIRKVELDTQKQGYGNFYLKPNGVFYITKEKKTFIKTTENYVGDENIEYATQSGPMLIIDNKIHPKFNEGSKNVHIRNGVGVLPNGNLLFAMSKKRINFFRLAKFFKENNCENALYLDGFVSKTYLPSKNWIQEDGKFGIIIAEIK